ncbi:hypothetical protein ACWC09_24185 [Streptomyces sp. NPDC001617]
MAIDPTDPETFEDDGTLEAPEFDVEAPENDAAEQYADAAGDRDDPLEDVDPARGNEADLVEQHRVVSIDEDDYR